MKTLTMLRALSPADRSLVVESSALLLFIGVGLRLLRFATLRRLLNKYSSLAPRGTVVEDTRVVWAVRAASRRMPVRTSCLVEALAADTMLRQRGYECILRLGVWRPGSPSKSLRAHAWLERQGMVVLGELEELPDYAVLSLPRVH
jgi:Transglutaminase-like superfamily